ncbi:MAG: hypothetical protein GTO18_00920 [Anaerolineales bacterium]|nr:hypothetical protein [Anaerolineales bacterium]
MSKKKKTYVIPLVLVVFLTFGVLGVYAWNPLAVEQDPLVRMPGTQPGQVNLEASNRCINCHGEYDSAVESGFNWMGSMMAQAARDFLFWSCLTVAAQDSIWAVGTPNATDICERCHFPKGWLEGRSDPTNASLMTGADYDGVQCDFCHRMWDPFFETTYSGTREGADWITYWDETNASGSPSQPAADSTYALDKSLAQEILNFNSSAFFTNNLPPGNYLESGSGQFFVSPDSAKRASFADAAARHQMEYSRFHKSKYFCATCHDVSNPILANLGNDPTQPLNSELNSAFTYFHVERTFSEFMLSAYGLQGGAATNDEFQAQGAPDITWAAKCQDCHMRDVTGVACNKNGVPTRPDESIEHPNSGQPLHDLTGGNLWVSSVLASAIPGSPNYDPMNDSLLNQGPAVLTLDLSQGMGVDPVALLAGVDRAEQQLLLAATITNASYNSTTGVLSFRIQNNTGHKLISGFPEGRRMFVNIKAYDSVGDLIYEVNPYDYAIGTLKGLPHSLSSPPLGPNEVYLDELVYEMHPSSTLTGEQETFHFALADGRYKDNRIPPKGFRISEAGDRISVPVWLGEEELNYFTAEEYAGGYDDVTAPIATNADYIEINLYYQTTSREYIEFLRDEINGVDHLTLTGEGAGGDPPYIIQTDPFFAQLKAWGNTIWDLWSLNMNVPGAAPFLMTTKTFGVPPEPPCVSTPSLISATPGHTQVTLEWNEVTNADGYNLYYDQAGKAQFITEITVPTTTTFIDTGLTNGLEYCYKVTAYDAFCETAFSGIFCATPTNQGQSGPSVGVTEVVTGIYTGKGKARTFTPTNVFNQGDTIVIRALVKDESGLPISNATVSIVIGGPEIVDLNSNPSDANGWAEALWQTQKPNKKGQGGTLIGSYSASVSNVTASGYNWDVLTIGAVFTIE